MHYIMCIAFMFFPFKEIDILTGGLSITTDRQEIVDFTTPHVFDPSALAFRIPSKAGIYFVLPFGATVWVVVLILPVLAYLIFVFPIYVLRDEVHLKCDSFLDIWKALTTQGNDIN